MEQLGLELHMTSSDVVKLVLGIVTFAGVCVTAYYSFRGQREARGANRAVNGNAEGTVRLYDLAVNHQKDLDVLSAWMKSYQGGPLDKGHKVVTFVQEHHEFVENTQASLCKVHEELTTIDDELHVIDGKIDKVIESQPEIIQKHGCPFSLGEMPVCGRDPNEIINALDHAKQEVKRRLIDAPKEKEGEDAES
jgi:hypothetical protein